MFRVGSKLYTSSLLSSHDIRKLIFSVIFGSIAQACANKGSPITAAPAEATFSAVSGGSLFPSSLGSAYSSCASGRRPGFGGGEGHGGGRGDHCSWTTFTGNWGGGWLVSWSGFGSDKECSTTTGSSLTTSTSRLVVSATTTGTAVSPSLGATVTTTVNGQTLTGTIFSAQEALATSSGTAAAQNGGPPKNDRTSASAAVLGALLAARMLMMPLLELCAKVTLLPSYHLPRPALLNSRRAQHYCRSLANCRPSSLYNIQACKIHSFQTIVMIRPFHVAIATSLSTSVVGQVGLTDCAVSNVLQALFYTTRPLCVSKISVATSYHPS